MESNTGSGNKKNEVPHRVIQVFENSNLMRTISSILDEENFQILKKEIFSELVLIPIPSDESTTNISVKNNDSFSFNQTQAQLVQNMFDFLEDCMIDVEYSIVKEFIEKLFDLYHREMRYQTFL